MRAPEPLRWPSTAAVRARRSPTAAAAGRRHAGSSAQAAARFSIPRTAGLFARRRLFKLLDAHGRQGVVSWLSAPAGAGKTSVVASWLRARRRTALWMTLDAGDADPATFFLGLREAAACTGWPGGEALPLLQPAHHADLAAFARQFFRTLYGAPARGRVLVLDNWQDLGDAAEVTSALRVAVAELPAAVHLVVLSRNDPPPLLARERLARRLAVLDWPQLRLTPDECAGLAAARGGVAATPEALAAAHRRADGWAAGVVLLLEQQRLTGPGGPTAMAGRELLFDYFASEVFDRASAAEQEVLLSTAMLARVDAVLACALSGRRDAGSVLEQLARHNFFTLRRDGAALPSYEVHALFREFLTERARARLGPARWRKLLRAAARRLGSAGDLDAAFELHREAGDKRTLAGFVARHAGVLLGQGRTQRLQQWIGAIEPARRSRELVYWEGMALLPHAPDAAQVSFERAYRDGLAAADRRAALAAWCGVVESLVHARTDLSAAQCWIDEFEALDFDAEAGNPDALQARVCAAMFMLLMWVRPQHPQLPAWFDRVRVLLRRAPAQEELPQGVSHQFFFYQLLWQGDARGAGETLRTLDPGAAGAQALHRAAWLVSASHLHALRGEVAACLDAVEEGLRIGAEHGVHAWDMFLLSMPPIAVLYGAGDVAQADRHIARLRRAMQPGRVQDELVYHSVLAWRHVHAGAHLRAEHHLRAAVGLCEQVLGERSRAAFFPQLWRCGLAHVLARSGRAVEAQALMAQVLERCDGNYVAPTFEFMADLMHAELRCDEHASLRALRTALAFARERGLRLHLAWCPQAMAGLFLRALEAGIETEHVRATIAALRLPAPEGCRSEAWPWEVTLRVLGEFEVRLRGQRLVFATKAQKRPLLLLKALAVLPPTPGGGIGEERLAAMFWPGADAAAASHALTTALYRLRRLIGEDAVRRQDGRLSLVASRCWVDLWAVEQALDDAGAADRVARLCRGALLEDDDAPWIEGRRERLLGRVQAALGRPADEPRIRDRSVIAAA